MKTILATLLIMAVVTAATISIPDGTPTKLQNGINITTQEILNDIRADGAYHHYIMRLPSISAKASFGKAQTAVLLGKAKIGSVEIYPITKETAWVKEETQEACEPDWKCEGEECKPVCRNTTARTPMLTVEYGTKAAEVDTSKNRNYLVVVKTGQFETGKWGGNVDLASFDPLISSCGALSSANTVYEITGETANITGAKTCAAIESETGTCADTNAEGGNYYGASSNEVDDLVYAYINITNSSLNTSSTTYRHVYIRAGFPATAMQEVRIEAFDFNGETWYEQGSLTEATGWEDFRIELSEDFYDETTDTIAIRVGKASIKEPELDAVVAVDYMGATTDFGSTSINGSTCFTVTAQNVTLDCNGFSITGNNTTATSGIYSNQFNTTIRNCNIQNFYNAIYLNSATNATIDNVNASGLGNAASTCYGADICMANTAGTTITNSVILPQAVHAGIRMTSNDHRTTITGTRIVATYNAIYNDGAGANLSIDCQGATIAGSNVTSSYGVYTVGINTTVRNCNIQNFSTGILYSAATDGLVQNNNVSGSFDGGKGIYFLTGSHRNTATGNSISIAIGTGYYVQASNNNTIDCQGASITGSNASSTYGAYSNSPNTTIRNCNLSNFAYTVYLTGAQDCTVANSNISSTKTAAMFFSSAHGMRLENNSIFAAAAGIALWGSGNYLSIRGNNVSGTYLTDLDSIDHSSISNNLFNNSGASYAVMFERYCDNDTFANNTIYSSATTAGAIHFISSGGGANRGNRFLNNTIVSAGHGIYIQNNAENNTIDCQGASITGSNASGKYGIYTSQFNTTIKNCNIQWFDNSIYLAGATNDSIINNTFTAKSGSTHAYLNRTASDNTFYWNNFTATSGLYVNDTNGSNRYNSTEGNIYHNAINTSVAIWGSTPALWGGGLFRGTTGGVPYNNSTSLGKFICNFAGCQDGVPLTTLSSTPAPASWRFTAPISYLLTYYLNGSIVSVNWTNSTSPIGRTLNCSTWIHLEDGTKNDTLASNTSEFIALTKAWNTTGRNDLFYYANGTCCDYSLSLCTSNLSATFGVYTPTISVGYSAYAVPDMQIIANPSFTEYLNYTFYPNRIQGTIGTNLTLVGNVLYSAKSKTAQLSSANDGVEFGTLVANDYYRTSFARNIYGEESKTAVRTMSLPKYATQPTISQSGGGGLASLVYLGVFTFVLFLVVVLLGEKKGVKT